MPSIKALLVYIVPTFSTKHYNGVIMSAMASQITGVSIVCFTVCSCAYQRKHKRSVLLAFVRGIHRWPVDSPHNGSLKRIFISIWWRRHEYNEVCALLALPKLSIWFPKLCILIYIKTMIQVYQIHFQYGIFITIRPAMIVVIALSMCINQIDWSATYGHGHMMRRHSYLYLSLNTIWTPL